MEDFAGYLPALVAALTRRGVRFSPGLTDAEVADVERTYAFTFPPDLRGFLQYALPVSSGWVDWRGADASDSQERLDWPAEGICFDIEHNGFWHPTWGERPDTLALAFAQAREYIALAPRLIPIYSHRYLPADPLLPGNPVFSVYQTDIIYYGYDLATYFAQEFAPQHDRLLYGDAPDHDAWRAETDFPLPGWAAREPRPIRFWGDI